MAHHVVGVGTRFPVVERELSAHLLESLGRGRVAVIDDAGLLRRRPEHAATSHAEVFFKVSQPQLHRRIRPEVVVRVIAVAQTGRPIRFAGKMRERNDLRTIVPPNSDLWLPAQTHGRYAVFLHLAAGQIVSPT